MAILSPSVLLWPQRRAGLTFYCSSADENGEYFCCMQAKQCNHNGTVIFKAPLRFLEHYGGREAWAGAHQRKSTVSLSETKRSRTQVFSTLLWLMMGGTLVFLLHYLRRQKILKKIFPLPTNLTWSISTQNQGTFEFLDKINLSPTIIWSFILHKNHLHEHVAPGVLTT